MSTLKVYKGKLVAAYKRLESSELVSGSITQETMDKFASICNSILPIEDSEIEIRSVIRELYVSNPVGFIKCLTDRTRHYILLTEGIQISHEFDIHNHVEIKWNGSAFYVVPRTKGAKKAERSARSYKHVLTRPASNSDLKKIQKSEMQGESDSEESIEDAIVPVGDPGTKSAWGDG